MAAALHLAPGQADFDFFATEIFCRNTFPPGLCSFSVKVINNKSPLKVVPDKLWSHTTPGFFFSSFAMWERCFMRRKIRVLSHHGRGRISG